MSAISKMRHEFRQRLKSDKIIVCPGTGDALGARLSEAAGFEAVYMSGYAVEGSFGKPDVGLVTMSEMVQRAAQIVDATRLPVIADADTGYGDTTNVARTVREFERAGVAALQLEDQSLPKKCGSLPGKQLVATAEMVAKIKTAVDIRSDPNLLVIGRTDIAASQGIDAALDRVGAYADAGADILMALGPYDRAGAERFIRQAPGPVLYLNSETFTMPMIPVDELERLGAKLAVFCLSLVLAAAKGMSDALREIKTKGTTLDYAAGAMIAADDFNRMMGLEEIEHQRTRFAPVEGV